MASFYPYFYEAAIALCIDARIKAGLSQAQLAERVGQTERFVASYKSGGRLLDPAEYIAICRAIGVDPYELLQKAEKGRKLAQGLVFRGGGQLAPRGSLGPSGERSRRLVWGLLTSSLV